MVREGGIASDIIYFFLLFCQIQIQILYWKYERLCNPPNILCQAF